MDKSTIIGLLLASLGLLFGFMLDGGHISGLVMYSAALIVFGGTFGAVITGTPIRVLKKVPYMLKITFKKKKSDLREDIIELVGLSRLSQREGLLALEEENENNQDDSFLYEGMQMVIDGIEEDSIRDILYREMDLFEDEHMEIGKVFKSAGGYGPTMGIIGTVMGLVHVLSNLSDPSALGGMIATAFLATLYGVSSANVIYLPLFDKICSWISREILRKELQTEALLSIQKGENPIILKKKLMTFTSKIDKKEIEDDIEAESNTVTLNTEQEVEAEAA